MIIKALYKNSKDKTDPKLKSLERNPIINSFLIIGTNYFKIQKLTNDQFIEQNIFSQNRKRAI
jgi:hypothetical protein